MTGKVLDLETRNMIVEALSAKSDELAQFGRPIASVAEAFRTAEVSFDSFALCLFMTLSHDSRRRIAIACFDRGHDADLLLSAVMDSLVTLGVPAWELDAEQLEQPWRH